MPIWKSKALGWITKLLMASWNRSLRTGQTLSPPGRPGRWIEQAACGSDYREKASQAMAGQTQQMNECGEDTCIMASAIMQARQQPKQSEERRGDSAPTRALTPDPGVLYISCRNPRVESVTLTPFLALALPVFFLSTILVSRIKAPSVVSQDTTYNHDSCPINR